MSFFHLLESLFTCFLKDKTLHNHWDYAGFTVPYYNIPSNNRELQLHHLLVLEKQYYNIPSNNRELQPDDNYCFFLQDYNIPSNNRELQQMSYFVCQFLYYNIPSNNRELQQWNESYLLHRIITYQVITGNYSGFPICACLAMIITYQVITGNYSNSFSRTNK